MKAFATKLMRKAGWVALEASHRRPRIEVLRNSSTGGQTELVHCVEGPVYIEPEFGYAITEDGVLIEASMDPNKPHRIATWRLGMPSAREFFSAIKDERRVVSRPLVLSLRHWWEWNYFHFVVDVLGKLAVLDALGFGPDAPLAVGRYARQLDFAEQCLKLGGLGKRDWLVPDLENRTFIKADKLVFCQALGRNRQTFDHMISAMDLPAPPRDSEERIFLIRKPPASRCIANLEVIVQVTRQYGFREIDATGMPVKEQIALLTRTRHLILIHGAGMVNTIYRQGAPLGLLELHPANYTSPDLADISSAYGYRYATLSGNPVGGKPPQHTDFEVDPGRLKTAIENMLS